MSRARAVFLVTLALTLAPWAIAADSTPTADWLLDQVKILSAPDMEGRASGTPGAARAAAHIAEEFRRAGLAPAGDAGGFLQAFTVPTGIRLGPTNTLAVRAPSARALALGTDFTPLSVSADGAIEGDVAFAGYGITAPDLGYDDYAGIDVRDKVVLVLTREPRPDDPASPFRRPDAYHYSERSHKIINARQHGARAILLAAHPSASDALPALRGISQPWGILAAHVSRTVADSLAAASGATLADLARAIDGARAPRSRPLTGARVALAVSLIRERGSTGNVVGILRGTDAALAGEAIVVGAHYDHLGHGGEGSLAPEKVGVVHPGADDNASGTAVVMGLARRLAAAGGLPRTIVFIAFGGEEMGLLGSAHYVKHPAVPLEKTALMLNFDMVGRMRDSRMYAGGVDSGTGLRDVVTGAARDLGLKVEARGDPFAPSDHVAFYNAGRPVLFFFTGAHPDYHRPSDTWEKVDAQGLTVVTELAARIATAVAREPAAPRYVKIEAPQAARPRGAYGPYFGVVPDFAEPDRPGVRVGGVRPGSPAEKAGVRAGDVLVRFAGVTLRNLEDFTFALRGRRPGERIDVTIVRDGQERALEATLEERR
jgi:hypothetical protein